MAIFEIFIKEFCIRFLFQYPHSCAVDEKKCVNHFEIISFTYILAADKGSLTFADKFSKSEELVPSPDDNSETNRADSINHDDGLYILGGYLAKTQPPKVDNEPQRIGSY